MKHRLQTLLKHKIQWLILLTALLGVSQGVWAGSEPNGDAMIVLSSENSVKSYAISTGSWEIGCSDNLPTSGGDFSGKTFTVTSYDLVLKGTIFGGWANGGNWFCGILNYKLYSGSEPSDWNKFKVGNYDSGSSANDVMCSSGDHVYVGLKDQTVSLTEGKDPGTYTFKAKATPRTKWNSGSNYYDFDAYGPVSATVKIDGYLAKGSGYSTWNKLTNDGDGVYSYELGEATTIKISNKKSANTTFDDKYSVGTSTGVTISKSSHIYTISANSGYDASTIKIFLNTSTHKVYGTATASCTPPSVPTSVTASPSTICNGSSSTLSATVASGTLKWWNAETGGTQVGTNTNLSVSPSTTTVYWAEADNGSCASSRVSVTVTVNALPSLSLGLSPSTVYPWDVATITATTTCTASTLVWKLYQGESLITTGAGSGTYYTFNKTDDKHYTLKGISSSGSGSSVTYTVKVDGNNGTCNAAQATQNVTISAAASEECGE